MKTTYILIPGLGDHRLVFGWFYAAVVRWWGRGSSVAVVVSPRWVSTETYERKYQRLHAQIVQAKKQGREVVLIGISAGASLGLLAYAQEPHSIRAFVAVCGFTRLKVSDRRNPKLMELSWYQAADAAEKHRQSLSAEELARIATMIPKTDNVIAPEQQIIPGASVKRMAVRGHVLGIIWALVGGRRFIVRFASSID